MFEMKMMPAVGFYQGRSIEEEDSFVNEQVPIPSPQPQDLLVKVTAVSVNPIDTKLREKAPKSDNLRVLGFDGVGEVVAVGQQVKKFSLGDRVFYAGTTTRPGSNQAFQLVDERIAARAPAALSDEAAAALPLTALTAYELLFEKFGFQAQEGANHGRKLLVINGAGGVGSILTQLAHWSGLEVAATASEKNFPWLRQHGVTYPVDYHQPLKQRLSEQGLSSFDAIAVLYDIRPYFEQIKELVKPFGHVGTIVGIDTPLDIGVWKNRSVSFDWEYMFAKTDAAERIETQGATLEKIAALADQGKITSTLTRVYSNGINAATIKQATAAVEAGHMQGKAVVSGPFNGQQQRS